jgi:glycosyltransferase involved in cell wall biosynthesis
MKVLLCHTYYQQRGGEDHSYEAESALLESRGDEVLRFTMHNDEIDRRSPWSLAGGAVWSQTAYRTVRAILRRERPSIVHCTNLWPMMSPSVYYAAKAEGIPLVQSLRNYRLVCVNGFFYRHGGVCEACLDKPVGWPGIVHACYRDSRAASAASVAVAGVHRAIGTWNRAVTLYVTPTEFARRKFIAAGFPGDRIVSKPNFIEPAPAPGAGGGGYLMFAGRLSPEKGVRALLDAWSRVATGWRLKIVGDGPERERVIDACQRDQRIEWLGEQPLGTVLSTMGDAVALVMPTVAYETFGRAIMEAFAVGTPVVASRSGATPELVDDRRTGVLFDPGGGSHLAAAIQSLSDRPSQLVPMRRAARAEFERRYTGERNYALLMGIYRRALQPWSEGLAPRAVVP